MAAVGHSPRLLVSTVRQRAPYRGLRDAFGIDRHRQLHDFGKQETHMSADLDH
jgi:hypothetical protein